MRILIVSDAWEPQINGVVRSLQALVRELARAGHEARVIGPDFDRGWRLPFYREIALDFFAHARLKREMDGFQPDHVHIATEGPMGWTARRLCLRMKKPFSTAYHTHFPEYAAARAPAFLAPFVKNLAVGILRRFHAPSWAVFVTTDSLRRLLEACGFRNIVLWPRGVDAETFRPRAAPFAPFEGLERPILLYVGRVAVEKNIPAFLSLDARGTKVVIGDGPELERLCGAYPDALFLGAQEGDELARAYANADLFVFPSRTDTFGLVLLEACASGLRIAAHPVLGPADLFASEECRAFAVLDEELGVAVRKALSLPKDPSLPRVFAQRHSWQEATRAFLAQIDVFHRKELTQVP